jgi:hypothetical protein
MRDTFTRTHQLSAHELLGKDLEGRCQKRPSLPDLLRAAHFNGGVAGSGETTVGRRLAASLGVPLVERDASAFQPGWDPTPRDEFRERVRCALSSDGWLVDGNYRSELRDIVWAMIHTLVWIDLSPLTVTRRVIARTLRRVLTDKNSGTASASASPISSDGGPRRTSSGGRGSSTPTTRRGTSPPWRTRRSHTWTSSGSAVAQKSRRFSRARRTDQGRFVQIRASGRAKTRSPIEPAWNRERLVS